MKTPGREGLQQSQWGRVTNLRRGDELREQIGTTSVYWLEKAMEEVPATACSPLAGRVTADICIVGGGFTGLWAALEIAELSPDSEVVLIDAGSCGFGASGRNGGWATSWIDQLGTLISRFGEEQGLWLANRSTEAVKRLGDFLESQGYGQYYRNEGTIWVASGPGQTADIENTAEACRAHGFGELIEDLDPAEVAIATGYGASHGGVLIRDSASVQPGVLVRLMREQALRQGIRIYEASPMIALEREAQPIVTTPAGQVVADSVIIATNAWAAEIRELRRSIVAVASQIVLTEPLGDRIDSLDWSRGALLGDARFFVHYAQVTLDGRVAFGRGGGALGRAGKVLPEHFNDPATTAEVAEDFRRWFPHLADVRLTHSWSGPVDRAPGKLPFLGSLGDHGNIHYGIGYSGNGVAPSAFIGRILGRMALGIRDEHTTCGLVGGPPGYLPPEPLRHVGGTLVRNTVKKTESREEAGQPTGPVGRLAKRLTHFSTPRLWR